MVVVAGVVLGKVVGVGDDGGIGGRGCAYGSCGKVCGGGGCGCVAGRWCAGTFGCYGGHGRGAGGVDVVVGMTELVVGTGRGSGNGCGGSSCGSAGDSGWYGAEGGREWWQV